MSSECRLQKAALEVHDASPTVQQPQPQIEVEAAATTPTQESVRSLALLTAVSAQTPLQTIKLGEGTVHSLLQPSSQGRASGLSLGRGDLDQAIRSMRDGKRRARPHRPASKIFVDGTRTSRIYD